MKPPPINRPNEGAFLYLAFYESRQVEVYAHSAHQARQWATRHFSPPKHKLHLVHVVLGGKNDATEDAISDEQAARLEADRLRHEMDLAARMQRRLRPVEPPRCNGFEVFGDSHSTQAMGGDYFDFFSLDRQTLGIAIGDVCGHGFASALTMIATRAYVRAWSLSQSGPARVLQLANRALAEDIVEGHFVTLMLADLDPLEHSLRYAGAGHLPVHVLSASGEVKAVLNSQGPALGLLSDYDFAEHRQPLVPGDLVLFMTDGIIEATGPGKQMFGMERALEVLHTNLHEPARIICRELCSATRRFAGNSVLADDATCVVIRVQE